MNGRQIGTEERRRERLRRQRRSRRKRRIRRLMCLLAAAAMLLAGGCLLLWGQHNGRLIRLGGKTDFAQNTGKGAEAEKVEMSGDRTGGGEKSAAEAERPEVSAESEALPEISVDLTHLYSPCAVLADLESGAVLAENDGDKRIYPASLTKIMTELLAIESLPDLEEEITLPAEMFSMLLIKHASVAGFEPEETVRVKDLLYGILLPSGAECCIACADRIAGSEAAFAERMNEKAEQLGLTGTHFCNSTGLHEEDHYSTAQDMAKLLRYALQNETFREIFTCVRYTTAATDQHPEGLTFESTLFKELNTPLVTGGTILGGKTGYTRQAGLCLASLAEIGGRSYILVTAKAEGSHDTEAFHVLDAVNVYGQIGGSAIGSEE